MKQFNWTFKLLNMPIHWYDAFLSAQVYMKTRSHDKQGRRFTLACKVLQFSSVQIFLMIVETHNYANTFLNSLFTRSIKLK